MDSKINMVSVDDVLFTDDMKTLLKYPSANSDKTYHVPDGVITIGEEAFDNSYLEKLILPIGITTIVEYAFSCKKLKEVYIPKTLKKICLKAFSGCDAIKSVFYEGSINDWNNMDFTLFNESITRAAIIYNFDYEKARKIEVN